MQKTKQKKIKLARKIQVQFQSDLAEFDYSIAERFIGASLSQFESHC